MIELILGGARSGKSRLAEQRARASNLPVTYIATSQALDAAMAERIAIHQQQRPSEWFLIEEPLALADALDQRCAADQCVLVDCLTLWLTNLLLDPDPQRMANEQQRLLDLLPTLTGQVILVSNETGLGVVPMGELTRRYVDAAGWLHQSLAQISDRVTFCVAGLPMTLKGEKP
ncbi:MULTISPECIES: bifunctional adenosylcobinamide kinase/adenosylcobinamide-phosphate guanylyltransferase [Pseudomonas]|uniref:bifunctional adenosylcobinamide kinase/adenosylcobinamide-phosphate guanylyltransferase n=1 Tax=Pseudomonas TaxID=286 RepID=UPI001239B683|nr:MULTISPECIES: bifunctional adenosylcobinamide kinase/adenosylcobinamide-phosphate guanylyltransferase [Pseudomonas]QIB49991.1 bifunctional adenosylcobinamide kinase/adenosylcobinamide-phosphate guanylyltransferase [Pseudomonas sp. OIL-1]